MNIVELKSGKSYRPNAYGLNNSHYHQTLLYDLILETNLGKKIKRNNFILYSAESEQALRYAPTIKAEQTEAIRVRNRIYMEECRMQESNIGEPFIKSFIEGYDGKLSGFKQQDHNELKKIYGNLSEIEKSYWESSFAFLSREYSLSKIGDELSEKNKGLSSLWQLSVDQKKERFLLIDQLVMIEDNSQENDPHIMFDFSVKTHRLNNFRIGDMVILYPSEALRGDRLQSQIFKCTMSVMEADHLVVRLRSRQMNSAAFDTNTLWNIEHDILDSSFSKTFRQLYHFANAEKERRQRILGILPPENFQTQSLKKEGHTTEKQHYIIEKAISTINYQLIWGPPGTGKTSVVLKGIVKHYYEETSTRILIIAYTNRAVDEICGAISGIDEKLDYVRIGSRYSCGEEYKAKLLKAKLESLSNRKEVKSLLLGNQIYIGTLASILGRSELFEILEFGVCLVDEASQILEPSLVGILSKTKKFILIGDHKQLPAIVLQKNRQSHIHCEGLRKIGFDSFSNSLFERLYNQAIDNKWEWAYSQLQEQGRMHESIMDFVNDQFYNNQLVLLPNSNRLSDVRKWKAENTVESILGTERMIFIPSQSDDNSNQQKVNVYEARLVCEIVKYIKLLYDSNMILIDQTTIGIITPFRAQIALINSEIAENGLANMQISVDTVERYQGTAKDIIIISTVVNTPFQLTSIISENNDGMDRKLNVALSRAKEQVIMIGNPNILNESEYYFAFIDNNELKKLSFFTQCLIFYGFVNLISNWDEIYKIL